VRCQTCLVDIRIEALDKRDFVRGLVSQVVPLVFRSVLDTEGSTLAISVDVASRDEVFVGIDGAVVTYGEWFVGHGVSDRSPYIDDAVSAFQKVLGLVGEMILYTLGSRGKCLVDMNTFDWATRRRLGRHLLVSGIPPDGMVKDEDSLCAGMFLQDFLHLCVVHRLDLVLIRKVFLNARMVDELEPADVETQSIFLSSCVMDDNCPAILAHVGPCYVWGRFVDIVVRGVVVERSVIVESRVDVAR